MHVFSQFSFTSERQLFLSNVSFSKKRNVPGGRHCYEEAHHKYQGNLVDVEVQMLSKLSTAVKAFERKELSKKLD